MQCITDVKNNIQRNRTVRSLNAAHMGAADIDQFGQLALGQISGFSIVCDA